MVKTKGVDCRKKGLNIGMKSIGKCTRVKSGQSKGLEK